MNQIALPLGWPEDPSADEFLVGPSNLKATQMLERWGAWPVMTAILTGPRKSGRSLLARIFAAKTGAGLIDDAEGHAEAEIFHAWNRAQADRKPLLVVADSAPPEWQVKLPDLRSRLAASPVIRIEEPDDSLVHALLERQFLRRGLDARPELIQWLAARIERSHVSVTRVVDALDQEVMERRKRLSVPLARTVLTEAGLLPERAAEPPPPLWNR